MNVSNALGGGLVEISAVATLIGAPIAEALVHGYKAACGLAWAPMSFFGIIHVTKACLSAAGPDWLRESLGMRNEFVDMVVGIMLPTRTCDCGNKERGNSHRRDCTQVEWLYFVPIRLTDDGDGAWVYAHGKVGVGLLTAETLAAEELDRRFTVGRWKISIKSVEELQEGLDVIREAAQVMMGLVKGPAVSGPPDGKEDKGVKESVVTLEAV
ncbi:hypothetical protein MMC11_008563 [Xylographa trunciseda]|nr:hypothetical protein [Xylographa trunciseda]